MRAPALIAVLLPAPGAAFAEGEIAFPRQAILLLKILKFDHSMEKRAGATATVVVVYQEGDPEAEAERVELLAALEAAQRSVTFPLPVKSVVLPYVRAELAADPTALRPVAIYVTDGLGSHIPAISKVTRKLDILSFSDV